MQLLYFVLRVLIQAFKLTTFLVVFPVFAAGLVLKLFVLAAVNGTYEDFCAEVKRDGSRVREALVSVWANRKGKLK